MPRGRCGLSQPDGVERIRRVVEDLLPRELAPTDVPEHGVAAFDVDPARLAVSTYLSKEHQPITQVDQLPRLRPVARPGIGPLLVEADEALVPVVDGVEVPQYDPLLGRMYLDIGVVERKESFEVPAVVRRLPHA